MTFVSLQNISTYSLLNSPTTISDLITYAKHLGYESIALTDFDFTYGLIDFYKMAIKEGIKPILGVQLTVKGLIDRGRDYKLVLLANNATGLANLNRISSAQSLKKYAFSIAELAKYLGELTVIVPANLSSELKLLSEENPKLIDEYLHQLQKIIPRNSQLYLGVYGSNDEINYIKTVKEISKQFKIELVALEDVQYLKPEDQFVTKILRAIEAGEKIPNPTALINGQGSHFLDNPEAVVERYQNLDLTKAVSNTEKIANSINIEINFGKVDLPKYKQDKFPTSKEYLADLVKKGLIARFGGTKIPTTYLTRVKYELEVINEMGFADYFLIVWDVINHAHKLGVMTGPGRGSAAGSLVSYLLKITEVDPIKYGLLFERFLNPARKQMPDIDLDIPDDRRPEILEYMFEKYGIDHVAQIITFGTFGSKQALRDVGRMFGLSMLELSRWSKAIPRELGIDLKSAYQKSKELQTIVKTNDLTKLLFKTALQIEGLPRHDSTHAAGIVLTDQSLAAIVGLKAGNLGLPVTQQAMANVEQLGLLKIDFLGLRNLTILADIIQSLADNQIEVNLKQIPLNDQATLELFQRGDTEGIFQFDNSEGIKQALREIKPTSFEDIIATNALYRPGPSQNIPHYAARKNKKEPISYPDQTLKPILEKTYGIIVYQEQVMQVAQILAGFSLADADILRRAISKKKADMIEEMRIKFIEGTVKQGHTRETGRTVFDYIERFGNYGFNRSHAVAYSEIAYWLAYLKVHYPAAFYVGLLNSSLGDQTKAKRLLTTAQMHDVTVLRPDINTSLAGFSLIGDKIGMGFLAVKGVSKSMASEIIKARTKPYQSLRDFLQRIPSRFLDESATSNLIKAGAFNSISDNQKQLLNGLHDLIDSVQMSGSNTSLFEILEPKIEVVEDFSAQEKANLELEVLGISLSQNRLIEAKKFALKYHAKNVQEFAVGEEGLIVGQLLNRKEIVTKKNQTMAFLTFTDGINDFEVTAFPEIYAANLTKLIENDFYLLKVRGQADRLDPNVVQFILINLRQFNFKK